MRDFADMVEEAAARKREARPQRRKRDCSPLEFARHLESDHTTADFVGFDELANQIVLLRDIPWLEGGAPRQWQDFDDAGVVQHLNASGFPRAAKSIVHDVIELQARKHKFHPIRTYLNGLTWDNRERLGNWLIEHAGAVIETEDQQTYVEAISRAVLIGAVARIMKPGCKLDTMLILEGPQGALKSSMLRALAVEDAWFADSLPHDLASKDASQYLAGRWIIEMPEVGQFRRSDVETVKAFLSRQADRYRPAYGRATISVPRQCILVGTTNEDAYLHDPAGNRRFWPVKTEAIDVEWMLGNRRQLWAEAVAAYLTGERWWLSPEIEKIASAEQADRVEHDPWDDHIAAFVMEREGRFFTTNEIMSELAIKEGERGRPEEMRISRVLRKLGLHHTRKMVNGVRRWGFEETAE